MRLGLTFDDTFHLKAIMDFLGSLPERPMVRLICDEPESGFEFSQLKEPMRQISGVADIMVSVLDSYYMIHQGIASYRNRTRRVINEYGQWIKCVEIGNEIAGDWLGDDKKVAERVAAAGEIVKEAGFKTAVTWYYDGNQPTRMFEIMGKFPLDADLHLVSWYPNWSSHHKPNWNDVFDSMAKLFPRRTLGFGEFGCEPRKWKAEQKAALIREIHSIRPNVPEFQGFYFYWNAYEAVVKKEKQVLEALRIRKIEYGNVDIPAEAFKNARLIDVREIEK